MSDVGNIIREYRKREFPDKSMRKVAEEIDFDHTHLSRIENNKFVPKEKTITKIADGLGLDDFERFRLFYHSRTDNHKQVAHKIACEHPNMLISIIQNNHE